MLSVIMRIVKAARVPPAGSERSERALLGSCLIEVEWLRIELRGKSLDLIRIQPMWRTDESLADVQVFEMEAL